MTKLEALIGLNKICAIGTKRLEALFNHFSKPEKIFSASSGKLQNVPGIGQTLAEKISSIKPKDIEHEFALAKKLGLEIIGLDDAAYPENLKNIPSAPIVLYVKGTLEAVDKYSIAMVGSRQASLYGLSCAEKFASELAQRGITVVSGMARGIDTSSHKGALKQKGRTIAVIGSGFNNIYPPENRNLIDEIAASGAVISEFAIDTQPLRENFPRRNRVISGLSIGILVVEAARNSGALITAGFALEQGREVFALPGKIDNINAQGTNDLIKDGAKIVTCVEDILEEFNFGNNRISKSEAKKKAIPDLNQEELRLYGILSVVPLGLDEIVEKTNMEIPKIMNLVLGLEMRRLIRQLPGKQFIRN